MDNEQARCTHCKKMIVELTHVGYVSCMTPFWESLFGGMERWNGMVEWNGGME